MAPVVQTVDLTKRYGEVVAVDSLSLQVEEGEVFGFLGPNGAGKTTTILMLLGLTEPTSGYARVLGHDPTREPLQVKRITGYIPENVGFYEDLTAMENLMYTARLNRIPEREARRRILEAMEQVGLAGWVDRPVGHFSRGMKQRLGLAELLVKRARLAILDEPTSGIDPEGALRVLELIQRLRQEQGMTFIISSHLLYQVQRICTRIGIIVKGRLIAQGTLAQLGSALLKGDRWSLFLQAEGVDGLRERVACLEGVTAVEETPTGLRVRAQRDLRPDLARLVLEAGGNLLQLRSEDPTLEEIYLTYFQET